MDAEIINIEINNNLKTLIYQVKTVLDNKLYNLSFEDIKQLCRIKIQSHTKYTVCCNDCLKYIISNNNNVEVNDVCNSIIIKLFYYDNEELYKIYAYDNKLIYIANNILISNKADYKCICCLYSKLKDKYLVLENLENYSVQNNIYNNFVYNNHLYLELENIINNKSNKFDIEDINIIEENNYKTTFDCKCNININKHKQFDCKDNNNKSLSIFNNNMYNDLKTELINYIKIENVSSFTIISIFNNYLYKSDLFNISENTSMYKHFLRIQYLLVRININLIQIVNTNETNLLIENNSYNKIHLNNFEIKSMNLKIINYSKLTNSDFKNKANKFKVQECSSLFINRNNKHSLNINERYNFNNNYIGLANYYLLDNCEIKNKDNKLRNMYIDKHIDKNINYFKYCLLYSDKINLLKFKSKIIREINVSFIDDINNLFNNKLNNYISCNSLLINNFLHYTLFEISNIDENRFFKIILKTSNNINDINEILQKCLIQINNNKSNLSLSSILYNNLKYQFNNNCLIFKNFCIEYKRPIKKITTRNYIIEKQLTFLFNNSTTIKIYKISNQQNINNDRIQITSNQKYIKYTISKCSSIYIKNIQKTNCINKSISFSILIYKSYKHKLKHNLEINIEILKKHTINSDNCICKNKQVLNSNILTDLEKEKDKFELEKQKILKTLSLYKKTIETLEKESRNHKEKIKFLKCNLSNDNSQLMSKLYNIEKNFEELNILYHKAITEKSVLKIETQVNEKKLKKREEKIKNLENQLLELKDKKDIDDSFIANKKDNKCYFYNNKSSNNIIKIIKGEGGSKIFNNIYFIYYILN